jgi:hypothetical protein
MHSSRSERSPRIIDVSEVHGKRSDIGLRHNRSAQGVANDRSHRAAMAEPCIGASPARK